MKKLSSLFLLFAIFFTTSVQALPASSTYTGMAEINAMIRGGKGTVNAVGNGAIVTSKGDVLVQPSGLILPVQATATIPIGNIIGAITGCATPFTGIGAAVCAASIGALGYELSQTGLVKCALGDTGYCKPASTVPSGQIDPKSTGWFATSGSVCKQGSSCSARDACTAMISSQVGPTDTFEFDRAEQFDAEMYGYAAGANCFAHRITAPSAKYDSGRIYSGSTYVAPSSGTAAASTMDLSDSLKQRFAQDPETAKRMLEAVDADIAANPTAYPISPYSPDVPYTVTAPKVTGTPMVTETKTFTNPDGSTSTQTTTETTSVTPSTTGSTLGNTKTDFPVSTTSNVSTVNNTTNVTTPGPSTVTTAPATTTEPLKIPDDYNREATQQKIAKSLDSTGMVDGSEVDKDADLKKIQDQNDAQSKIPLQITETSLGIFWWMPSVPTAECVNPTVPNNVGAMLEVDICSAFNTFKTFISAVMVYFCVLGAVAEVKAAAKV